MQESHAEHVCNAHKLHFTVHACVTDAQADIICASAVMWRTWGPSGFLWVAVTASPCSSLPYLWLHWLRLWRKCTPLLSTLYNHHCRYNQPSPPPQPPPPLCTFFIEFFFSFFFRTFLSFWFMCFLQLHSHGVGKLHHLSSVVSVFSPSCRDQNQFSFLFASIIWTPLLLK